MPCSRARRNASGRRKPASRPARKRRPHGRSSRSGSADRVIAPTSLIHWSGSISARSPIPVITGAIGDMGLAPLGIDTFAGRPGGAWQNCPFRAHCRKLAEAVVAHYSTQSRIYLGRRHFAMTDRARAVVDVLKAADAVGLSADDYRVEIPADGFDISQSTERQKELMAFEMKPFAGGGQLHSRRQRADASIPTGSPDTTISSARPPTIGSKQLEALVQGRPILPRRCWRTTRKGAHFEALRAELKRLQGSRRRATASRLRRERSAQAGPVQSGTGQCDGSDCEMKASDELQGRACVVVRQLCRQA
jgi:hypothetical protein